MVAFCSETDGMDAYIGVCSFDDYGGGIRGMAREMALAS